MKRRRRKAVDQITPTIQTLLDRHHSGITSEQEITRRVVAGLPNKSTPDMRKQFNALKQLAVGKGWVAA